MIFLLLNAAIIAVGLFAIFFGGRPERHGALWFLLNCGIQYTLIGGLSVGSATVHLVADGIYALGLIPLAFFHMSWWIGAMSAVVCGSFTLQAVYLELDKPADVHFAMVSNVVLGIQLLTFLIATCASYAHRHWWRKPIACAPSASMLA